MLARDGGFEEGMGRCSWCHRGEAIELQLIGRKTCMYDTTNNTSTL
jgi:hypothetical protein